jgi:hypothetical protein
MVGIDTNERTNQLAQSYIQAARRPKGMQDGGGMETAESKAMYHEIKEGQTQCLAYTDEKLVVVDQVEREIENYMRQIDKQIERFRKELKDQGVDQKMVMEEPPAESSIATSSIVKSM